MCWDVGNLLSPNSCNLGEVLDQMEMIPFARNQRNSKLQKALENLGKLLFGNQFVFRALPAQGGRSRYDNDNDQ